jgi:hypothetical protein
MNLCLEIFFSGALQFLIQLVFVGLFSLPVASWLILSSSLAQVHVF